MRKVLHVRHVSHWNCIYSSRVRRGSFRFPRDRTLDMLVNVNVHWYGINTVPFSGLRPKSPYWSAKDLKPSAVPSNYSFDSQLLPKSINGEDSAIVVDLCGLPTTLVKHVRGEALNERFCTTGRQQQQATLVTFKEYFPKSAIQFSSCP